ncbi:hypothetical protein ES702_01023 [subsurface metagenome]
MSYFYIEEDKLLDESKVNFKNRIVGQLFTFRI